MNTSKEEKKPSIIHHKYYSSPQVSLNLSLNLKVLKPNLPKLIIKPLYILLTIARPARPVAPDARKGNHLPNFRAHIRDFDFRILGREIKVRNAGQDERLGLNSLHGGFKIAIVGLLRRDIAGLPGVEHGKEVFGIFGRPVKLVKLHPCNAC